MSMNRELLTKVRDRIADQPDRFDMDDFFADVGDLVDYHDSHWCGTAMCIGGWALWEQAASSTTTKRTSDIAKGVLDAADFAADGFDYAAAKALFGGPSGEATTPLFYTGEWPEAYQRRRRSRGEAAAAVDLINDMLNGVVKVGRLDNEWWLQFAEGETP